MYKITKEHKKSIYPNDDKNILNNMLIFKTVNGKVFLFQILKDMNNNENNSIHKIN
jgi:hypothetical protein